MKKNIKNILLTGLLIVGFTSCHDDLDLKPIDDNSFTSLDVYKDANSAKSALAKLYAGLALTGQQGPAGQGDVAGIDEGASSYTRLLWYIQEGTTDNAVIGWFNDDGVPDIAQMTWTAENTIIRGLYYRIYNEIALCNDFIRNAAVLAGDTEVDHFIAEARFLRALMYYNVIDLFGSGPFVTDADPTVGYIPPQHTRIELFNFVESELLAIESEMVDAKANEYGRADKAALWTLLSRLYLNAEVYTGMAKYTEAVTYAKKTIDTGYSLVPNYQNLFMADNDSNGAQNEVILSLNYDGAKSQSYGGTTFLVNGAIGGTMDPENYGSNATWAGLRVTREFVERFESAPDDADGNPTWSDDRALFYTDGQSLDVLELGGGSSFASGYAFPKFSNKTSSGANGVDLGFPDTDYPLMRISEAYLNYAEALLRGGSGGSEAEAKQYINDLRSRAKASPVTTIDLNFILDERSRELSWEGLRRTDLIRYGLYAGSTYVWQWKGNIPEGGTVEEKRNLLPIPSVDLIVNPNLTQNSGY